MSISKEAALALRKPFPSESVGQLPKPYKADSPKGKCVDCGGWHGLPAVHLDYVGHAAVTDRLLTVDPEWSWEPFALSPEGLPAPDKNGNLWIRLTVCGVTRIGVGDGKTAKEVIGDAIRNAAMRFGVGLDLWAKENLVEFAQAASGQTQTTQSEASGTANQASGGQPEPDPLEGALQARVAGEMTANSRGRMFALFAEHGITDPDQQRAGMSRVLGREVTSRGAVTEEEVRKVNADLASRPRPVTTP